LDDGQRKDSEKEQADENIPDSARDGSKVVRSCFDEWNNRPELQ
jgi:hypothetical protein